MAVETVIGNESSSASLICIFTGIPQPSVAWTSLNMSSGLQASIVEDSVKYAINETYEPGGQGLMNVRSVLTVLDLSKSDELFYRCDGNNNITNLLNVDSTAQALLIVQGIYS